MRDKTRRTGTTLAGALAYTQRVRPLFLLLENVAALCDVDRKSGQSNLHHLRARLLTLGYTLVSSTWDARRSAAELGFHSESFSVVAVILGFRLSSFRCVTHVRGGPRCHCHLQLCPDMLEIASSITLRVER